MLMECRRLVERDLYISLCWSSFDQNLLSMLNGIIHNVFFIAMVAPNWSLASLTTGEEGLAQDLHLNEML